MIRHRMVLRSVVLAACAALALAGCAAEQGRSPDQIVADFLEIAKEA